MIEKLDPNDQRPYPIIAKINELIDWVNEREGVTAQDEPTTGDTAGQDNRTTEADSNGQNEESTSQSEA